MSFGAEIRAVIDPPDIQRPPVVGFLGLGSMGRPMARQIIKAFPTVVFDIVPEACHELAGETTIAASLADLASRSDVIVGCLPTPQAYRDCFLDPDGLPAEGRYRTYVHVGTTGSPVVTEIAQSFAARGIAVLDAPMTGGPVRAASGSLTTMVSGPVAVFERFSSMIASYSSKTVYLGERIGAAQTMKMVNNLAAIGNLVLAGEALALGTKAGLDPDQILEVLNSGTGQNFATTTTIPKYVLNGSFNYGGTLASAMKDYVAIIDEAQARGVPIVLGSALEGIIVQAIKENGASGDWTRMVQTIERAADTEIRTRTRSDMPSS
jgi:3-hydroxyisobutyrate dehydrogenase-like beta-hydroxyacid dehydrogenase